MVEGCTRVHVPLTPAADEAGAPVSSRARMAARLMPRRLLQYFIVLLAILIGCAHCANDSVARRPDTRSTLPGDPDAADGSSREDLDAGSERDAVTSIGAACASRTSLTCSRNCLSNEVCFTQILCPIGPEATPCSALSGGDDRCHRKCGSPSDCAQGEDCFRQGVLECTDFGRQEGICCLKTGCE
jgi:hypothetical protein